MTPYRVKIGVSACLHNGAGSTTKDIGVIGTKRGWEIYVGGSSGRNVKAGQLFTVAETEEETISIITGLIQYYRETANYSERTWEWLDRVSLLHVREVLFDLELRQQLLERLEEDFLVKKGPKDVTIS
jgi:nitrite reductase (NADH) large subunit